MYRKTFRIPLNKLDIKKIKISLIFYFCFSLLLTNQSLTLSQESLLDSNNLELIKKHLDLSKKNFEKAAKLLEEGIISKSEHDEIIKKHEKTELIYKMLKDSPEKQNEVFLKTDKSKKNERLLQLYNDGIISEKELLEAELEEKFQYLSLNKFTPDSDFSIFNNLMNNPLNIILKTPLKYITSKYGFRNHPLTGLYSLHSGIDIAAPEGSNVYSYDKGLVEAAFFGDRSGNCVKISHGNGYTTVYMHLKKYSVKPGDFVNKSQIIGQVGSTGWSTGNHIHFEIRLNNKPQNINKLFEK
ncbi:MAG: M23 family metallopeptidase [Cyanobacteriota bacterium]